MANTVFDQVVRLVSQLTPEERDALIRHIRGRLPSPALETQPVTRDMLLAEHARLLAAGAFEHVESLHGRFARPDLDLSFEEIESAIHEQTWEDELDDIINNDTH